MNRRQFLQGLLSMVAVPAIPKSEILRPPTEIEQPSRTIFDMAANTWRTNLLRRSSFVWVKYKNTSDDDQSVFNHIAVPTDPRIEQGAGGMILIAPGWAKIIYPFELPEWTNLIPDIGCGGMLVETKGRFYPEFAGAYMRYNSVGCNGRFDPEMTTPSIQERYRQYRGWMSPDQAFKQAISVAGFE